MVWERVAGAVGRGLIAAFVMGCVTALAIRWVGVVEFIPDWKAALVVGWSAAVVGMVEGVRSWGSWKG